MRIKLLGLLLPFFLMAVSVNAQPAKDSNGGVRIDGVAGVVGDEIILDSDIERDFVTAQAQGYQVEDHCEFFENILVDKLLLTKAKEDTLIQITNDQIDRQVNGTIQRFLTQGSEKEILDYFGYTTLVEFKQDLRGIMRDQAYAQDKQDLITKGLDATPEEVREFYEKYESELPDVPEEVTLNHIVIYPEISAENEQKVVDELLLYKEDIEGGASFATKAILYSDDPGSATNGGLITAVKRGQMVPEFDAVVFNLEEGEISQPFKTEFGYHIAQLEKRRGQELDVRHILVRLKPTADELAQSTATLDSIILEIEKGNMTFKEAVYKYSVDKYTKYNGGRLTDPRTGEDKMEKSKLPSKILLALSGMNDGDISKVYEDEFNGQTALFALKLEETIPTHRINMETDYSRLKNLTLNTKRQETVMDWVKINIDDTFITISKDYDQCEFKMNWRKQ